ncbi:hypothetical protein Tsubulata_007410, partial [Turnera subulata]
MFCRGEQCLAGIRRGSGSPEKFSGEPGMDCWGYRGLTRYRLLWSI